MILETVKTVNEKREITRVKTSVILIVGFSFIPLGIYLLIAYEMLFGLTLILFFAPCFILYPLVRFFISVSAISWLSLPGLFSTFHPQEGYIPRPPKGS